METFEESRVGAAVEMTRAAQYMRSHSGLTHSPDIGELAKAMAAARKKFKVVKKDTLNPFFKSKYADLAAVIEATAEPLAEHDLAIIQSPRFNGQTVTVVTMLMHGSGQWMRDDLTLPMQKFDAQGAGSAITYARRYSYQSFVNVAAEADDDGNAASGKDVKEATMPKPPAVKATLFHEPGTPFPLWQAAQARPNTARDFEEKVEAAADMQIPLPSTNGGNFPKRFWAAARKTGKDDDTIRKFIGYLGYEHTDQIPEKHQKEAMEWAQQS